MKTTWTVVTRKPRGRYFRPVANAPEGLDWHGAVELAGRVAQIETHLDVWYVPDQASQAEGWPEDRDNILTHTGRRVPIRWDSTPQVTL